MEKSESKIDLTNSLFSCWNIDPEWHERFSSRLQRDGKLIPERSAIGAEQRAKSISVIRTKADTNAPGVAIINLSGVLLYSAPEWYEEFGLTGYNLLSARLASVMSDPSVKTVILRVESPGGMAIGASEMSEKIFNARSQKKIIAVADPYAFSAAYEIGSATSEFYLTRTGMVGSIGSYTMHVDASKFLEEKGYKITFIKAGEKKTDGNSYEPLSDRAKSDLQREVDFYYGAFVSDVARNRNVTEDFVKENFGKGGRVLAEQALSAGMIDGIAPLEDLIKREVSALVEQEMSTQNRGKIFVKNNLELLRLEE